MKTPTDITTHDVHGQDPHTETSSRNRARVGLAGLPIALVLGLSVTACEDPYAGIDDMEEEDTGDLVEEETEGEDEDEAEEEEALDEDNDDFVFGEQEDGDGTEVFEGGLDDPSLQAEPDVSFGPGDRTSPLRVIFYNKPGYNSGSAAYYTSSTSPKKARIASKRNNKLTSMMIAPGCKVTVYDSPNWTGRYRTFNATTNGKPRRIKHLAAYSYNDGVTLNNTVSSFRLDCNSSAKKHCGFAYKKENHTGHRFPVFDEELINLASKDYFGDLEFPGWNDKISSFASNSQSSCEGVGLWEHASGGQNVNQRRLWLSKYTDYYKDENFFPEMKKVNDKTTVIEADRHVESNEVLKSGNLRGVGRALMEKRSWGKAFFCNLVEKGCDDWGQAVTGATAVTGMAICSKIVGAGVVNGIAAGAAEYGSGGAATPVAAPLASYSAWQIASGLGCLAATGAVIITGQSACAATEETWCDGM